MRWLTAGYARPSSAWWLTIMIDQMTTNRWLVVPPVNHCSTSLFLVAQEGSFDIDTQLVLLSTSDTTINPSEQWCLFLLLLDLVCTLLYMVSCYYEYKNTHIAINFLWNRKTRENVSILNLTIIAMFIIDIDIVLTRLIHISFI